MTASFAPRPILPKKHNHPKIDRTRSRLHPEPAQTAGYVQGEKGGARITPLQKHNPPWTLMHPRRSRGARAAAPAQGRGSDELREGSVGWCREGLPAAPERSVTTGPRQLFAGRLSGPGRGGRGHRVGGLQRGSTASRAPLDGRAGSSASRRLTNGSYSALSRRHLHPRWRV